ncbi:MAG: SapC family protein [Paraglaciecola sp.]|nr:SapC family protein [Paraglaciecola sp.]NCT48383.1 SapC family protein [Paraglaciecola sp.]
MPNHQLLDNITHKDLHIICDRSPTLGDAVSYTNIFLAEFRHVQGDYPIFFHKHSETGQFEAISLFGFATGENLFLDDAGWHAAYIPLTIERRPFLIGFQRSPSAQEPQPVVHIDMESPRISYNQGEPVFLAQGGQSPFLQRISGILKTIHEGHGQTDAFIQCLLEHDLLEAVSIKVQLKDGSKHELNSLYTVHEERLAALSAEVVATLHQKAYLQGIYMVLASMANMPKLIELKNQRL